MRFCFILKSQKDTLEKKIYEKTIKSQTYKIKTFMKNIIGKSCLKQNTQIESSMFY